MAKQSPINLTIQPCWSSIIDRVRNAYVFIDDTVAECLHWSGSATILDKAGALSIKQFSSFETPGKCTHAVFIVSSKITSHVELILEDIIKGSSLRDILFVSTLPPDAHTNAFSPNNRDPFEQLESKLSDLIDKPISNTEVIYLPLGYAPITNSIFYLPSCAKLFPLLPTDWKTLEHITTQSKLRANSNIEMKDLPTELQSNLKNLVYNLHSFLSHHEIGEEIFTLGRTSELVADELASLSAAENRRSVAVNKASLILVDRSLDVTSCVGHHSDSLLDRILRTLPALSQGRHHVDVGVDMSPLTNTHRECICDGCLASSESLPFPRVLLHILADRKQRESLHEIYRHISSAVLKEKISDGKNKPGSFINDVIESKLSNFKNEGMSLVKYSNILTIAMAAIETLKHTYSTHQDTLWGIEKGLLQNIGDIDCAESLNLIKDKLLNDSDFTLDDMFQILIYYYGLCDFPEISVPEKELMDAVVDKVTKINANDLSDDMKLLFNGKVKTEIIVKEVFYKLRGLSQARADLKEYKKIHQIGEETLQTTMNPILRQVLRDSFDSNSSQKDLVDIKHKSTGLKSLFKSSFSFLMNRASIKPNDQPLIIIFVIGGVTISESRKMQEMANKTDTQILIGSTTIATPKKLMKMILLQDNLQTCN